MDNIPCCYTDDTYVKLGRSCNYRRMDGLPMCEHHMMATFRLAIYDGMIPDDLFKEIVGFTNEMMALKARIQNEIFIRDMNEIRERKRVEQREADKNALVYYIRLTRGRVKIGTTKNLAERLKSFRSSAADLLAIEQGSYGKENLRHRQFAHLRLGRSEEFTMAQDLVDHINSLRAEGSPMLQLESA